MVTVGPVVSAKRVPVLLSESLKKTVFEGVCCESVLNAAEFECV